MGLDTSWTDSHPLSGMGMSTQTQTRTRTQAQAQKPKRSWSEWPQFKKELEALSERVKTLHNRWLNHQLSDSQYRELLKLEDELFRRTMEIKDFR